MELSIRLQNIANQVDKRRIADIGCDHGKLVAYLFENKKIDYAFVTDISLPSVKKAVKILTDMSVGFDWACGDGTEKITNDHKIEEGIISGMGGLEIIKIFQNSTVEIKDWVLQPQNNEFSLKKYLIKNKYKIIKDFIVKDKNIYYNILRVQKSNKKQKISDYHIMFGKENFVENEYFSLYLDYLKSKLEKILLVLPKFKKGKIKIQLKWVQKAQKELRNNG